MSLTRGTKLGSYEIVDSLGAGGMGEVYRAKHVKLGREAAIKVLPPELASDPERLRRFEREARAASALNHPAIVTIYDIDEHDGTTYIAMELVEGVTLREKLQGGRLTTAEALRLARSIADGLARAHAAGIVHRDLKPDNVMITADGHVKILDFGLAKQLTRGGDPVSELTTLSQTTREGLVMGTVPYMSPEQAAARPVDPFSDQFSFGVVLYEMVCGDRPFQGESVGTVLSAILRDTPPAPRSVNADIPKEVEDVIHRCLEKDPAKRFSTTKELHDALERCAADTMTPSTPGITVGRRSAVAALGLLAVVGAAAAWFSARSDVVKWMERDTLAEITALTETGELTEAWRLARGVHAKIPGDPDIQKMIDRITIPVAIVTDPPGAGARVKAYATADAPWVELGETPLQGVRVPYALTEWELAKEGYETFQGAPFGIRPITAFARGYTLEPQGERPEGMVRVPGGPYMRVGFPPVELEDYWLDKYEVTNRDFRAFVDAGGYENEAFWTEPFEESDREIPRAEAMARFVDQTRRVGPAGWELGAFPEGEADFPVGGVSWYEAAAYCRFVGKTLPTLHHWSAAAIQDQFSDIVRVSNFDRQGPAPVGTYPGLGDFGTYDMAGNVKEWVWNEGETGHYILGGSWGDPTYTFRLDPDMRPSFSRDPSHGFRCAQYRSPVDEALLAKLTPAFTQGEIEPVGDEVFAAYLRMYAYDPAPLEPTLESADDTSPYWRKETVSFKAAYGDDRVIAHLFLPRNAEPPFQPVVWVPGNDAFFLPPGDALASPYLFDFIPRSGRALIYPVYLGTYERHQPFSFAPNEWRDIIVSWSKDFSRTVDYLETRDDIDTEKLGYYGFSAGGIYGPIFAAVDDRIQAMALLAGGLFAGMAPEANPVNFLSRSNVPTLMINGEDDFLNPLETSQEPFFRLLGAPEEHKRHLRLEGGHIFPDRVALLEEVVGWFDRYLGPVERTSPSS